VRKFITESRPTYAQFEVWSKSSRCQTRQGHPLQTNSAIRGYIHDDGTRKGILGANGISDECSVNPGASNLNNLERLVRVSSSRAQVTVQTRLACPTGAGSAGAGFLLPFDKGWPIRGIAPAI